MNLQEDWDTCLLNGFYHHRDCNIEFLLNEFSVVRGLTLEQKYTLKRIPRRPWHYKSTVLRFICAYLPKIADILWKHKSSDIETLAKVMAKSSYDTQIEMEPDKQRTRDMAQFKRDEKKYLGSLTKKGELGKRFKSYSRNNTWGVTK